MQWCKLSATDQLSSFTRLSPQSASRFILHLMLRCCGLFSCWCRRLLPFCQICRLTQYEIGQVILESCKLNPRLSFVRALARAYYIFNPAPWSEIIYTESCALTKPSLGLLTMHQNQFRRPLSQADLFHRMWFWGRCRGQWLLLTPG